MRPLSLTDTDLQLTGRETVLLDLVDLDVAVGIGELRQPPAPNFSTDVAER